MFVGPCNYFDGGLCIGIGVYCRQKTQKCCLDISSAQSRCQGHAGDVAIKIGFYALFFKPSFLFCHIGTCCVVCEFNGNINRNGFNGINIKQNKSSMRWIIAVFRTFMISPFMKDLFYLPYGQKRLNPKADATPAMVTP